MLLSAVVVNWNSRDDLETCLLSLREQTHQPLEVIVVDNGSTDGSADMVARKFPEVLLLRERENLGFAEGCNRGIVRSRGDWIALLNNDAIADPGWATELVRAAELVPESCGMLQSLMLFQQNPDTINSTGILLTAAGSGRDRDEGKQRDLSREREEIFCPSGGACAYRRSMLEEIRLPSGYFDRKHFMYFEDMDLGWRARLAGFGAYFVPASVVYHRRHGSSDRHGRAWLVVVSRTNRLRTLVKNASWPFLLRTGPKSLYEIAEVLVHGRASAGAKLMRAVLDSLRSRGQVETLAKDSRRDVERRWVLR